MPTVLHPRALDSVDGSPSHRVVINRQRYDIDQATGTVDLDSEQEARALAEAYDVDRAALDPEAADGAEGESEADTCQTVKTDGEVCGRERPCQYHD